VHGVRADARVRAVLRAAALVCGLGFGHAASAAPAAARTLTGADAARIVNLEQPAISPDGKRVALIAVAADVPHARYANTLLAVDVASGRQTVLVRGGDVSSPRWSPDGTSLGYLAQAGGARSQLFVCAGHGGDPCAGPGAVRQITHAAGDVIDFAWRPDGAAFAFAAYDAPANAAALRAHHDYFEAGDNDYTQTAPTPCVHLWIAPARGGASRRLTSGSWTLPPTDRGGIYSSQFAWLPDGKHLFFVKIENAFEGDNEYSTLQRVDALSGHIEKVTAHAAFEVTPQPATRGNRLAYWYPRDDDYLSENEIHVLDAGDDVDLTRDLDRNAAGALWLPGGDALLVCADDGARVRFWNVPLSGDAQPLALGELNPVCDSYSSSTFDAGIAGSIAPGGAIAFLAGDVRSARELYYLSVWNGKPKRLTSFNAFLGKIDLGVMTPFAWDGALGRGSGVITRPPGMQAGRKYPIVLLIHGGPGLASVDSFVWEDWPLAQAIAAHGYIVLQPNYRGSDDAGNDFMYAIYRNSVEGPSEDILAALAAAKALPEADPARVAVTGWSYGGLLTSWLETRDQTWRAAVSGAAVNDEVQSYDLSVSNVQDRYLFGTSPYAEGGLDIYRAQSPITFASKITTPTLIWGTTGDAVVPVTMSYAMFRALRERHVPVKFVVFPGASHGPGNPVQIADLTDIWLDWLDRYLKE
jgi:dipeptidyl aminopeptidase/acylaminoacyl peptidase